MHQRYRVWRREELLLLVDFSAGPFHEHPVGFEERVHQCGLVRCGSLGRKLHLDLGLRLGHLGGQGDHLQVLQPVFL